MVKLSHHHHVDRPTELKRSLSSALPPAAPDSDTTRRRVPPRSCHSFDDRHSGSCHSRAVDNEQPPRSNSNQSRNRMDRDRNRCRSNSLDLVPREESFTSTRRRTSSIDNFVVTATNTRQPRDPAHQQQSRSCSDLSIGDLSIGDEATTNHKPNKGSSRWWNFMTTSSFGNFTASSSRPPIKSRHSDRVKSNHHQSSPELSLNFDDNDNHEREAVVSSQRNHSSASSNHNSGDDDINRRVAQMLGTSAPHTLDYPAFAPPPSSSSALRRRERRLRERYANQRSQSHDNVMEAASITGRNRNSHYHPHHEPPRGHVSQLRQHSYEPSMQCNPVSSMVLQNLPLIHVRYDDLFPDEIHDTATVGIEFNCVTTTNDYDRDNCSSSSISIGINHLTYTCTICSDDIDVDSTAIRLPCSHLYHNCESCILTWLMKYNTCPICRYALPTDTDLCRNRSIATGTDTPGQMKALHQKHYQSKMNDMDQTRPIRYTRQEIDQLSFSFLRQYYKSWVICTYNSHGNPKKLELPFGTDGGHDKVDSTVIDYLIEQKVIHLNPTNDDKIQSTQTRIYSQQEQFGNMSVKDLMSLVPPHVIATNHMIEKQDLIDFLLQQQDV
jgi:Ring finger domain